jgi:hypothetical protein
LVRHSGRFSEWIGDSIDSSMANHIVHFPMRHYSDLLAASRAKWKKSEREVNKRGVKEPGRVSLCFDIPKAREDELWARVQKNERGYKHSENSTLQIRFAEDCTPCFFCGKLHCYTLHMS